jgi:hypothetical protein
MLARLWASLGPEAQSFVSLTVAGVLGGFAGIALERRPIVAPHLGRRGLYLGFLGQLLIAVVAAHAVDHGFRTALVGAICGGATLRRLKREVDRSFEPQDNPPGDKGRGD